MPDQLHVASAPVRDAPPGPPREYSFSGNRVLGDARVQDGNRVRDGGRRGAPPPRPPMASRLPVPGSEPAPPRPAVVTAAAGLWFLAVVAGLVALIVSAVDLAALRTGLLAEARVDDRDASEQELVNGVVLTMATVALVCSVLLLLALLGLRLIDRRRPGAVGTLVATAVLTLLVVGIAQDMVAGGATELDRLSFLAQAALVLPATGVLLVPRARAWLHGED